MKRLLAILLSALMLASVLGVTASAEGTLPFTDIPEDFYARDEVQYMFDHKIMNGTDGTTFSPFAPYSRAMFVTMLGRMEGIDQDQYRGNIFSDVPATHWASTYVNWAAEKGIINGVGNGKFAPNATITMEQYCTIIGRYMDVKGHEFLGDPVWMPEIADMEEVSDYAKARVVNMVYFNLVDLTYDWCVEPKLELNRADVARYFTYFHQMVDQRVYRPADDVFTHYVITDFEIKSAAKAASVYVWNWFCSNNAYTEKMESNGVPKLVRNPYIATLQDLTNHGYQFYVFDAVQQLWDARGMKQEDFDGLYLAPVDGLGGFMTTSIRMDLDMEQEGTYSVRLNMYSGDELIATQDTKLIYDFGQGRWAFADLLPADLWTVPLTVAWG